VNDKDIEKLVRMAVEIDEIEQLASARAHATPFAGAPYSSAQAADDETAVIRRDQRRSRRALWRTIFSAAAAACVLLLVQPWSGQPARRQGAAAPIAIDYCPGIPQHDGLRIDHFEPTAPEYCVILAIFHTWHDECNCLAWHLYEWEDGRTLIEVAPGQAVEIALDVTDAPPVEQVLLVAVSRDPADLPRTTEETYDLMDCLNEVTPPTDPRGSAAAYASAVKACLAKGVRVIPQSFFVE
jgi:hypothetical protein